MGDSLYRKLRKILQSPEVPAHIRERGYGVSVPWHRRLWNAVRPPAASGNPSTMSRRQQRIVLITLAVIVAVSGTWWGYDYGAKAPLRATSQADIAMKLEASGDLKGAIAKFTDALAIYADPRIQLLRGHAYYDSGDKEKALEDWNRAIAVDPTLADAFDARGTHYRLSGNLDKALADLNESLSIRSTVDAHYQRGQVYAAMGKFQQAIDDFDQAIGLHRESPYVYFARAEARGAAGDPDGARQDRARAEALLHGR